LFFYEQPSNAQYKHQIIITTTGKIDHPVQEYQVEVTENKRSNMVQ
jgi:hypothetical protein